MSSTNNDEITALFDNIKKGIKLHGIRHINITLEKITGNSPKGDTKKIRVILKTVCKEFNITLEQLLLSNSRGDVQEARNIACCLLHFECKLSWRYIAKKVFDREWELFVGKAIKRHKNVDLKLKPDQNYKERYDRILETVKSKNK